MKKTITILSAIALIAGSCGGQAKNISSMIENKDENANSEGYEERFVDSRVEYRKENIVYSFRDGALTSIEQLDWGGTDKLPESYAYIYSNTPKNIIYAMKSGDRSQSETFIEITLEKTVYNHQYRYIDGWHIKKYEAPTPLDIWIKLSQTFNWDKFSVLKSGRSAMAHDGSDFSITVTSESGTSSVTNNSDDTWRDLLKVISDYERSLNQKAELTVVPR
jgi:hypothetical protein